LVDGLDECFTANMKGKDQLIMEQLEQIHLSLAVFESDVWDSDLL
jgi:hypothetical protein